MTVYIDGGILDMTKRTFCGYVTLSVDDDDSARLFDFLAKAMGLQEPPDDIVDRMKQRLKGLIFEERDDTLISDGLAEIERLRARPSLSFVASEKNTGSVTFEGWRTVELKRDGKPLQAGDLIEGKTYEFNRETGEVK